MQLQRVLLRALNNHFQNVSSTAKISLNSIHINHTNDLMPFSSEPETTKWNTNLDGVTLVQMLRNCTNYGYVSHGEQLHCYALRTGFSSDVFVSTSLVTFYAKAASLDGAHKLFDEMPQRNVVSWNVVLSGYVHCGKLWRALSFFIELDKSDIRADAYSFSSGLAVCGQLSLLQLGMSIHSKIIVYGFEVSVVVANCLIDMYGKCSSVGDSIRVFGGLVDKDVISWNSVIAASARNQRLELAFDYFDRMPCPDIVSYNELINGISRFGDIDEAIRTLRSMPEPNSSSWNAIISGYIVRNRVGEALDFLSEMHKNGVVMDEFTFSSILSGIACVSALKCGISVHCCTIKHGLATSMMIGSALIDMYSKCGQVKDAEKLFRYLSGKNIVTWNAMICGFVHNGESHKVVKYFEELKGVRGLNPDDITFLNVLAACSHYQMPLEKVYEYFTSMIKDYGITPKAEHVASMIRLMGHHGELCRAEKMIYELGFGSCSAVWRSLLGACGASTDLDVAKFAAAKLTELENHDEVGYVILSSINKVCGNWADATTVWKMMRDKGVAKQAGSSWIEGRKPM